MEQKLNYGVCGIVLRLQHSTFLHLQLDRYRVLGLIDKILILFLIFGVAIMALESFLDNKSKAKEEKRKEINRQRLAEAKAKREQKKKEHKKLAEAKALEEQIKIERKKLAEEKALEKKLNKQKKIEDQKLAEAKAKREQKLAEAKAKREQKLAEAKAKREQKKKEHKKELADFIKTRKLVQQLIKQIFIIELCSRCSDRLFNIIEFNSQFTSIHLECKKCNKKSWSKLIYDFSKDDVKKLKSLYKQHIKMANLSFIRNNIKVAKTIGIGANAHNIIKTQKNIDRAISQEVQDKVWNRDGGKCVKCESNEKLEFDHIIPVSKGGANTYRNIQLLCEPCNRTKSAKIG
jgi:hypothetical protein